MRLRICVALPLLLWVVTSGLAADTTPDAQREASIAAIKASITAQDWQNAGSLIDSFAAAYPDDTVMPHLLRGGLLQAQGKPLEALDEMHAGLTPDAQPAEAAWVLGVLDAIEAAIANPTAVLLAQLGDCYRIENGFAKAVKCYETALVKPDISADRAKYVRRWLIRCHVRNKEWTKVEKEIDAIAAESPECAAWAYYSLGKHHARYRKYPQAIAALTKALPTDTALPAPPAKSVQTVLVESYIGAKQWDNATALLTTLAAQNPSDAAYWHECAGGIYQGQKQYAEAIAELKQAITPPTAVTARKRLGECYRSSLPAAEAAPLIQQLVDQYPGDGPDLPTMAGLLYKALKDDDKAVADFKLVVERFPDRRWQVWDACAYIGDCCYAQGKGEEALTYIKDVYAARPQYPMDFAIAYGRTLLFRAKQPSEAAELFAKAIAEHPSDPLVDNVRLLLVRAYQDSGQVDKAVELLQSVISSDATPAQKAAHLLILANVHFAAKQYASTILASTQLRDLEGAPYEAKAGALYTTAVCYRAVNAASNADAAIRELLAKYPDSQAAKCARTWSYEMPAPN